MAWWFLAHVTGLIDCIGYLEPIGRFTCTIKSILAEYRLRSFLPWLASILLDVAVGGDVVQDPTQVVFIISKYQHSTKPMVILNFSTPGLFQVLTTVPSSWSSPPTPQIGVSSRHRCHCSHSCRCDGGLPVAARRPTQLVAAPQTPLLLPAITLHHAFGGQNHDDSVHVDALTTTVTPQTSSTMGWWRPWVLVCNISHGLVRISLVT